MLPIPIVWSEYTTTVEGQIAKLVPCEHCATEYVYIIEREGQGSGVSLYLTDEEGAQTRSESGAEDSLHQYLENDFDPVPCPVCGHYQRHMFPKLDEGAPSWFVVTRLAVLVASCLDFVGAMYCAVVSFQRAVGPVLVPLIVTLVLLPIFGLILFVFDRAERSRVSRFDPNTGDPRARIEKDRSRAVTRAEFEAARQQEQGGAGSV